MQIIFDKESEITEEDDEGSPGRIDPETQKDNIRKIIARQRSLYPSSDSLSASSRRSFSSSASRSSSSRRSGSLLELMKGGGMNLGRLFDMEHTTLTAHLTSYSGSPVTRPLFLWGSDSGDESPGWRPYWSPVKSIRRPIEDCGLERAFGCTRSSFECRRKLTRKRCYRALPPRVSLWRYFKGLKLLFRLRRRLNIVVICGKVSN